MAPHIPAGVISASLQYTHTQTQTHKHTHTLWEYYKILGIFQVPQYFTIAWVCTVFHEYELQLDKVHILKGPETNKLKQNADMQ